MASKEPIPSFDFFKRLDTPSHFEFHRLEQSYNVYDASHAHRHNYYEILFFEQSGGEHEIDFITYPIEKDSVHFISPEQVHRLRRDKAVTGFVISFTVDFLLNEVLNAGFLESLPFFNNPDALPVAVFSTEQISDQMKSTLHRIQLEFNSNHADKLELISSLLAVFLLQCRRIHDEKSKEAGSASFRSELTGKFKQMVEQKFRESKQVSEYASALNISAGHLNDTIQKDLGKSASDVLYARIILEAKRMLYHSSLTVKEIAALLNYEDPSHFSKFFKNHTGQTPEQFRVATREMYH